MPETDEKFFLNFIIVIFFIHNKLTWKVHYIAFWEDKLVLLLYEPANGKQ